MSHRAARVGLSVTCDDMSQALRACIGPQAIWIGIVSTPPTPLCRIGVPINLYIQFDLDIYML